MVDDLVEGRGFGGTSPVVLELLLCLVPRVTPEHTGLFGEVRLVGVLKLGRRADRDSCQASGRAVCACRGSGFTGGRAAPSGITWHSSGAPVRPLIVTLCPNSLLT